ncbi:MAG: hypothetical protein J4F50_11085 [Acidimicrobiia bacterium]|nr:hypothetical protein [Acidimicrobiia bacterium]
MTKLFGFLVVVCSIVAACGSSDTTTTAPQLVADPGTIDDAGAEPADTTATAPELVADRLPVDPDAPPSCRTRS